MKLIAAGLILLLLYTATCSERKTIKQEARKALDYIWEVQENMAETEEMKEWVRYWRNVSK